MRTFSTLLLATASVVSAQSALSTVEWRTDSARVNALILQLTPEVQISLVHGSADPGNQQQAGYVVQVARRGITGIALADGEASINVVNNATAIPVQHNVEATWLKSVAYAAGVVTGREAYALGAGLALAPRVNILRDPLTGNYWQSYSEDPFLNARLGIQGVAGI
jgi:beta-glucosidase